MQGSLVVIEDESENATLLANRFANEGFRVTTATNGPAGIRAVQQQHPRLILLDLLLPEMTGWEVVRLLKDNQGTREIPLIVLSAVSTVEDRIRLLEAGVDDFIAKPCSVTEVIARARAVLRRSEWRPEPPGGREAAYGELYDSHRG